MDETIGEGIIWNARCKYGWTPLYSAAHHGNIEIIRYLLETGADHAVKNNYGKIYVHVDPSIYLSANEV